MYECQKGRFSNYKIYQSDRTNYRFKALSIFMIWEMAIICFSFYLLRVHMYNVIFCIFLEKLLSKSAKFRNTPVRSIKKVFASSLAFAEIEYFVKKCFRFFKKKNFSKNVEMEA